MQIIKKAENLDVCTHLVRPVEKLTIPQKMESFWSKRS